MILRLSLAVFLCFLLGCTQIAPRGNDGRASLNWGDDTEQPFNLVVTEELNDGENLRIVTQVSSKAEWDLSKVVVVVTGLRDGMVQHSKAFVLAEALKNQSSNVTSSGTIYRPFSNETLTFGFDHKGSTDYEIELLWGREARAYISEPATSSEDRNSMAVLRNIQVQRHRVCDEGPCQQRFTVTADLVNTASFLLSEVIVGVGYVFIPQGSTVDPSQLVPESEEEVSLNALGLVTGASKFLKLELDDAVPERTDGQYYPVVRVLAAR